MSLAERLSRQEQPDRTAEVRDQIQERLIEVLGARLYDDAMEDGELRRLVDRRLRELLEDVETPLSIQEKAQIIQQIGDNILGLGPIEPFIRDPEITEVMVNSHRVVYIERGGKIYRTDVSFRNEEDLRRTIDKIVGRVGRRIDDSSPYVDARLTDGSRVNAIIPPLAIHGSALTIRKFSADPFTAKDLIDFGTLTPELVPFLDACVRGRLNILVSGGTGAGKTTLLNVLSAFLPEDERIITIEDSAELRLQQPHVVSLEYRPPNIEGQGEVSIRDLVRNALRMRPDRIVVGEVRGGETLDMLQAMNTGHDGSISTIHANSPRDVLSRLETLALMAGMDLTVRALREQVSAAIDLIVHVARFQDGVRRVANVTEVVGLEGDTVTMQDLFIFHVDAGLDERNRVRGHLAPSGLRPHFLEKLAERNVFLDTSWFAPPPGSEPW
ncbi:MAG TPA: CpaF family protein [Actinomycetota bacterium]|nr:CpaF family protein [Actinomycetota bacterium]